MATVGAKNRSSPYEYDCNIMEEYIQLCIQLWLVYIEKQNCDFFNIYKYSIKSQKRLFWEFYIQQHEQKCITVPRWLQNDTENTFPTQTLKLPSKTKWYKPIFLYVFMIIYMYWMSFSIGMKIDSPEKSKFVLENNNIDR